MAKFNSGGSFAQSAPGLGDQLGAIDLGDVHTQATQVSNQQDAMDTHTDIVFPHHQLPYRMLNRGETSLHTYTGAQDSKCEEVKEQIRKELKEEFRAEIELFKQNDEELKKVTWERDMAKKELELAKEKLDFANETKEKELKEKDQKIKKLTQLTETQEAQIRDLITEKQRLQKVIDDLNIKIRILNETVTNVQNQSEAGIQQCKEAISENSEQREEQIKNFLDKELEKRMREMFAVIVNVPSATVQEAASAASKLQGDNKNVSPVASHTPSPSRSPVNVPTPPPTPPTTSTGQEQKNQ